jgi:glutathione S-transferase
MTRYRLVSFKACPWVQRAAIVLREKQVDFEFVHIETGARPAWFKPISPHGKVPVLQIDEQTALFESNAIAEFLDETIEPRLQPADPVARALNRAWTDYLPTFSAAIGAFTGGADAQALASAREALALVFGKIEEALGKQSPEGPFFNGAAYSLVDAGYAPFLQRYLIGAELAEDTLIREYPRLARWADALVARATTHSFPPEEFRRLYLEGIRRRGGILALQERIA